MFAWSACGPRPAVDASTTDGAADPMEAGPSTGAEVAPDTISSVPDPGDAAGDAALAPDSVAEPPCGLLGVPCPTDFECTAALPVGMAPILLPNGTVYDGLPDPVCYSAVHDAVYVPPGPFWMGCNWHNEVNKCSGPNPQTEVVTGAYAIHRTEVTAKAYAECVEAGGGCEVPIPSVPIRWGDHPYGEPATYGHPWLEDRPFVEMTHQDAHAYCDWLGVVDRPGWHLCSSAEWEKAARGGCETLIDEDGEVLSDCHLHMRTYPWGEYQPTCGHASTSECVIDSEGFWLVGHPLLPPYPWVRLRPPPLRPFRKACSWCGHRDKYASATSIVDSAR